LTSSRKTLNHGGHKVGEKYSEFSRFFQSHDYTFPEVIATKLKVSPHLGLDKIVSIYIADVTSQENFTQSTVVLRKYSIILKLFYLLQFFSEVAQNFLRIPKVFHVQRNP